MQNTLGHCGIFARYWALLIGAPLLAGCGAGSTSDSAEAACSQLATANCDKLASCTSSLVAEGVAILRRYGDLATCRARQALACENRLQAPGTGNGSGLTESCAEAVAAVSCSEFLDGMLPSACSPSGALGNGTGCVFNGQCASAYCSTTKHQRCGVCSDPPLVGADCSASTCGYGQSCVASSNTCQALVTTGESCDATHPCSESLSCIGNTANAMGTCQPAATTEGAVCGGNKGGCQSDLGLACAGMAGAKTCSKVSFVADGMPCGSLSDGSRAECQLGACFTGSGAIASGDVGTCRTMAADGAPCDLTLGPDCMAPARCVTDGTETRGTCYVPTASGCSG